MSFLKSDHFPSIVILHMHVPCLSFLVVCATCCLSCLTCLDLHNSCQPSNNHAQMRIHPWFGQKLPSNLWMVSNITTHPTRLLMRRSGFSERNEQTTMQGKLRNNTKRHLQRQRPLLRLRMWMKTFFLQECCLA